MAALVQALVTPLETLQRDNNRYRNDTEERLRRSGQVCRLRALLNDHFDPVGRDIYITDAQPADTDAKTIFLRDEQRPIQLPLRNNGAALIGRRGLAGMTAIDFEVHLPAWMEQKKDYDTLVQRISALTRQYRLAGKRFTIVQHRRTLIRPL